MTDDAAHLPADPRHPGPHEPAHRARRGRDVTGPEENDGPDVAGPVEVGQTRDAAEFARLAAPLIAEEPAGRNVLATVVERAVAYPALGADALWMWAHHGGPPVAVAMHTPPRPPHIATVDPICAAAFAQHLADIGRQVDGVTGLSEGADAFARRWVELRGGRVRHGRRDLLYLLTDPVTAPTDVPGGPRPAAATDRALLDEWAVAFIADIGDPPTPDATMERQIDEGGLVVWVVDGDPVAMAYGTPPVAGHVRISWVYTPPPRRGHGFAGAVTAAVAARAQAQGCSCLLYADAANPVSNAVYRRLGFDVVATAVHLALQP